MPIVDNFICYIVLFTLLCILSVSDTLVEFISPSYVGSESLKGVPVILEITQGTINDDREVKVDIVPTNHSPVSAEGVYVRITIM